MFIKVKIFVLQIFCLRMLSFLIYEFILFFSFLHHLPCLQLARVMEEYMDDYNQLSTTKMKLVLFMDAVQHVCRIARILRQPLGNALLLGLGGSGRQSLTKLASHM